MDVAQLGAMALGLDQACTRFEALSGACGALKGLVLIEAKERLPRGEYLPWLKKHLGKSAKTAAQYVGVAKAFIKFYPRVKFEQLTLALMDQAEEMSGESLDLSHPMVRAVADWTKGRTFYQLKEEFCQKGGKTYEREDGKGDRKVPTAEEAEAFLKGIGSDATKTLNVVLHEKPYFAMVAADLDGLIANCKAVAEQAEAVRKMTKAEREEALAELLAKLAPPEEPEEKKPAQRKAKKGAKAK